MRLSCVNPQCPNRCSRYGLCGPCTKKVSYRLIPVCGFIPSHALSAIAKELLDDLKPTKGDTRSAIETMRGTRHRQGPWQGRPPYSAAVLHAVPIAPMKRRLPELLVGKRSSPTPRAILSACVHYHLARHVLGLDRRMGLYLAGTTFYGRRTAIRPKGVRREYRGKVVLNTYRLRFSEYAAIGRLCLKAAKVMGADGQQLPAQITTRYLTGVEAGEFNRPIVVHPACGITSGAGDHPLDHFLPRQDFAPNLPTFNSKIRRASGKIAGREEYPEGLDLSLEEQLEATRRETQARFERTQIKTTAAPPTDWLFN